MARVCVHFSVIMGVVLDKLGSGPDDGATGRATRTMETGNNITDIGA